MVKLRFILLAVALLIGLYGLWAAYHMESYIGTGMYWSNPWFYKAHAALFGMLALRILAIPSKE